MLEQNVLLICNGITYEATVSFTEKTEIAHTATALC
jgi:hypothetical protein